MNERAKNAISIIVSGILMFGLVLTTVFLTVTPESIRKNPNSLPTDVAAGSAVSTNPLIKSDGAVEAAILTTLLDKIGGLEPSGNEVTTDLGEINGGSPLTLKLFDTVADTTNDINKLTAQYWQVVYRTGNVLTLWMTEPYIAAQFNSTREKGKDYVNSDVRTLLNNTYLTLDSMLNLERKNIVVTPENLPLKWQTDPAYQFQTTKYSTAESNTATVSNNLLTGCEKDRLWLPSYAEVMNNTEGSVFDNGLWKTTPSTRTYTNKDVAQFTWFRSSYSAFAGAAVGSGSGSTATYVDGSCGVRPALHINLEALQVASVSADFTLTSESYGIGTGLENEVIDFNYTVAVRNLAGNVVFSLPISNLTPINITVMLNKDEKYTIDLYGPAGVAFSFGVGDVMFATPHLEFTAGALNGVKIIPIKRDYTWSGGTDIL